MSRLTFRLAEPPGSVELIALLDAEGAFFQSRQEAFPNATADDWRRADALDPQAVRAGEWWLRFRCFAVRHEDGRVVLVDLGVGPSTAPSRSWAPVPGRLPDELASAGISQQTVETVFVAHMHTDHIGWVTDGVVSTPLLPNARYLLQRTEIDTIERRNPAVKTWLLDPVRATGPSAGCRRRSAAPPRPARRRNARPHAGPPISCAGIGVQSGADHRRPASERGAVDQS